jgi:hypothetical protein
MTGEAAAEAAAQADLPRSPDGDQAVSSPSVVAANPPPTENIVEPAPQAAAPQAAAPSNAAPSNAEKPSPVARDGSFAVSAEMMSIVGCSPGELEGVLAGLGFRRVVRREEGGVERVLWRPVRRRSERGEKAKSDARAKRAPERRSAPRAPSPGTEAPKRPHATEAAKARPATKPPREKEKHRQSRPAGSSGPSGPARPAVDPNSPFAVLAALKPMLAKRR